jgi:hypothetical protein
LTSNQNENKKYLNQRFVFQIVIHHEGFI